MHVLNYKVRGNWQKRVEKAEVRRKESKQKKVNRSSKSVNKNLVLNQLWPLLNDIPTCCIANLSSTSDGIIYNDRNIDDGGVDFSSQRKRNGSMEQEGMLQPNKNSRRNVIHLWLDMPASSSKNSYHSLDNEFCKKHNNSKKDIIYDEEDEEEGVLFIDSQKKKSKRSSSKRSTPNKKAHPRSHESKSNNSKNEESNMTEAGMQLCTSHFFHGTCRYTSRSSKKSSSQYRQCPYFHYSKKMGQRTLQDILLLDSKESGTDDTSNNVILKKSSDAAISAYLKSSGGEDVDEESKPEIDSINMVYYLEICLDAFVSAQDGQDSEVKLSDFITEALSAEKCAMGCIAYVVMKGILIFDRSAGGATIQKDECDSLFHEQKESIAIHDSNDADTSILHTSNYSLLPVSILEHILIFLEDKASGKLPMVCKLWHGGIGKTSPALWQHLLTRKNWALKPNEDTTGSSIENVDRTRGLFVSHKIICQAIDNMIDGVTYLQSSNQNNHESLARKTLLAYHGKQDPFGETHDIHCWDESSIITSCRDECTLSVFKASKNDTLHLYCKQLAHIRVAPFPLSIKKWCKLESFGVDQEYILCAYRTYLWRLEYCNWLVLVRRDDLLLNSTESILDENSMKKFDLSSLFASYSRGMSFDDLEAENLTCLDQGRQFEFDDFKMNMVGNIVSCKGGHFLFLVEVNVITHDDDDDMPPTTYPYGFHRIIALFSAKANSITWCRGVSREIDDEDCITLSTCNFHSNTVVYSNVSSGSVIVLQIHPRKGITDYSEYTQDLTLTLPTNEILYSNLSDSGITILAQIQRELQTSSVVLLFVTEDIKDSLILGNFHKIHSFHTFQDYIVMKCETLQEREIQEEAENEFDGHWFGEEAFACSTFTIVVVHIPSRKEIYRQEMNLNLANVHLTIGNHETPTIFCSSGNGVVFSGQSLRDVSIDAQNEKVKNCTKTKVKGRAKQKKNNKKDGFARGMSMRG